MLAYSSVKPSMIDALTDRSRVFRSAVILQAIQEHVGGTISGSGYHHQAAASRFAHVPHGEAVGWPQAVTGVVPTR